MRFTLHSRHRMTRRGIPQRLVYLPCATAASRATGMCWTGARRSAWWSRCRRIKYLGKYLGPTYVAPTIPRPACSVAA